MTCILRIAYFAVYCKSKVRIHGANFPEQTADGLCGAALILRSILKSFEMRGPYHTSDRQAGG